MLVATWGFVRGIPGDEEDKAILSLGHELDLRVSAEGVETLQPLDFLRANGCDELQATYGIAQMLIRHRATNQRLAH